MEFLAGSSSVFTHNSESVSIVDEYSELVFLLEFNDLVEDSHCTCHSVNALGYKQNASALLLGSLGSPGQNFLAVCNIVMSVFHPVADMESETIHDAGVALLVINSDIPSGKESV